MSKVSSSLTSDKNKLIILHKIKQFIKSKPLKPQTHKINKEKLKTFINRTEELNNEYLNRNYVIEANINLKPPLDIQKDLKDFFKATQHVSYRTFKFILEQNFKELIIYCKNNKITKINVLLPISPNFDLRKFEENYSQKSQYWLLQHLYQYITKKKIKDIVIIPKLNFDNIIDDDSFILVIDDASYSGIQLTEYLLEYLRTIKNKQLTFYVLVSYISLQAKNRIINEVFKTYYFKNHKYVISDNMQIMNPLSDYLTDIQIYNIFRHNISSLVLYDKKLFTYTDKDVKYIADFYKNSYPIYFDHKLADSYSSFPELYGGIIPSIVNVSLYNDNDLAHYKHHYKYHFNYIENCEDLSYVDTSSPKCPFPPYKKEFSFSKKSISSFSSKSFKTINSYKSI